MVKTNLGRLPNTFYPTQRRAWLIDFWNFEGKWAFVAAPFEFLVVLLFYYDCTPQIMLRLLNEHNDSARNCGGLLLQLRRIQNGMKRRDKQMWLLSHMACL